MTRNTYKKLFLKGEGREWRLDMILRDEKVLAFYHITFFTDNPVKAKQTILDQVQKTLRRYKIVHKKRLIVMAMPYIILGGGTKTLNGDEMIRNKLRFSPRQILKLKDPDILLVQGYGPEAANQLEQ